MKKILLIYLFIYKNDLIYHPKMYNLTRKAMGKILSLIANGYVLN